MLTATPAFPLLNKSGGTTSMKGAPNPGRARKPAKRVVKKSRSNVGVRRAPSVVVQATTRRIADKMQRLALRRPKMLHLLEAMVDGMLSDSRRGDDPTTSE
jgi:hypothetical protein